MASQRRPLARLSSVTDALLAGGVAWLGTIDPAAGVAASVAAVPMSAGAGSAIERLTTWRQERVDALLSQAADFADISVDELMRRCAEDDHLAALLVRTLRATESTASRHKIVAYAVALGSVVCGDDETTWETMFVRVLDELDAAHIDLLSRFTRTANELGLASGGPEFDTVPESLNRHQVEMAASDLSNLPLLLAVLQRNGLLESTTSGGGMTFRGGASPANWSLTSFGREFLARLTQIGQLVRG